MLDICLCGIAREDCDYHKPVVIVAATAPVYDVSGMYFIDGVTNFTADVLFDAMIGMENSNYFSLQVDTRIFARLNTNGLLYLQNTKAFFHSLPIYVSSFIGSGPIRKSFVLDGVIEKVCIVTREW